MCSSDLLAVQARTQAAIRTDDEIPVVKGQGTGNSRLQRAVQVKAQGEAVIADRGVMPLAGDDTAGAGPAGAAQERERVV